MSGEVDEGVAGVLCEHKESDVEYIAQQEYPGGGVLWCSRCGAWRDDEGGEWHTPKAFDATRELIEKHKLAMARVIASARFFRELGVVLPSEVQNNNLVEFKDGEWSVVL